MKIEKRAQGLSVNAIILIVLGVIVLGVLVLGFTMGWSNFSSYFSTNNVQSVVTACQTACATQSHYDFCTLKRNIKGGNNDDVSEKTCNELATQRGTDGSLTYERYGIKVCPGLCPVVTPAQ